ncbi:MAG: hypothetical protein LUE87_00705, partial [Lachnospiraceae bacterium]|nr:hypothetical protein [Lachnospiraceae bacterium]
MNERIDKLLNNQGGNYIFPFFWQHGEREETLREYMRAIHESNIGAVCVESRPHPDFCGEKWWQDMDIILDEARNRHMKVWLLDDSHFPTGYANGAMASQPDSLCRQSVCFRSHVVSGGDWLSLSADELRYAPAFEKNMIENYAMHGEVRRFDDDCLFSLYAVRQDGAENDFLSPENRINLKKYLDEASFSAGFRWRAPEGEWKVYVFHLSRKQGYHRSY